MDNSLQVGAKIVSFWMYFQGKIEVFGIAGDVV
jgi:hypothetical protein